MSNDKPDFVKIYEKYDGLSTGAHAELRRARDPNDLGLTTTLYRLFPGQIPRHQHQRVLFLLPWCVHKIETKSFGAQLHSSGVSEQRVFQVLRSSEPRDIVQLRRLAIHIKPQVDWNAFGNLLWFWGEKSKRNLIEEFYLDMFGNERNGESK